jgi:20S proteasome alpha/beta subunit
MTAIVGLLCKDGVVVGADSSVSFTYGNRPLIEQQARKIQIINNRYILAGTGAVGMGQRFGHELEQFVSSSTNRNLPATEFCRMLAQKALVNFQSTVGNTPSGYGSLLAFASPHQGKDKLHLCEFEHNSIQPELKSDSIWYVSMGGGQVLTDPFLGFIRKLFWQDGKPHLEEGVFATYWCLQHAVDLNAGGINAPIDIAVLKFGADGKPNARVMDAEEMVPIRDNVKELEKYISEFKKLPSLPSDKTIPKLDPSPKV